MVETPQSLIIGIFLLIASVVPGWVLQHDATARLVIARQLWEKKTVFLNEARRERFVKTPKGLTTYFGIGQSLLFIPFDCLGKALAKFFPTENPHAQILPLLFLYLPLVGTLWWWLLARLLMRLGFTAPQSWVGATGYFLASATLIYSGQTFQEESLIGILVAAAFSLILSLHHTFSSRRAFAVGLILGSGFLFRLNFLFAAIPLGVLAWPHRRHIRSFLFGAFVPLSIYAVFSYWRFGNPLSSGYSLAYAQLGESGVQIWRAPDWNIALGLLFGPGKGLFVLSPMLLLAIIGFPLAYRRYPAFSLSLLLALFASAIFHSCLKGFACGGHAWGGRFQIHFLSFLIYPAAMGARELIASRLGRVLLGATFIAGIFIQMAGLAAPESLEYYQEIGVHEGYEERLITSFREGQLPKRLQNIRSAVTGQNLFPAAEGIEIPVFSNIERYHMPNLWGFSYAAETGRPRWVAAWAVVFTLSVILIFIGLYGLRKSFQPGPDFEMSSRHLKRLSLDLVSRRLSS